MAKRRGRGEGAIYRRENDGLWCSFFTIGYHTDGRRKRRYVYGKTKREVQEKLIEIHKESSSGILIDKTKTTVGEFLQGWLESVSRPAIKNSTYSRYEIIIRLHVIPLLGGTPLQNLQAIHVQNFLYQIRRDGKSERTCELAYVILKKALNQAVKMGQIRRNPCEFITKPKRCQKTMKFWSPEEIIIFLHAAKQDRLYALYVLAVTTGLRQGELFGLKWGDFNESNGSLSIQRTITDLAGRLEIGEPKSKSSRRKIDLPKIAVEALLAHKEMQIEVEKSSDWIFSDSAGGPLRRSNLRTRSFLKLIKMAELPKIRFHDLRHSAATLLFAQGVHPKIVQERLGHSQISITLNIYSHVLPSLQKEAVDKIDEALKLDE